MKLKLHTHSECWPRFLFLLHTFYTRDYRVAPFSDDVFTGTNFDFYKLTASPL